jgi:diguanylate cyclase (GGDEF)-like protein/PAS domain S-box-containing protein
VSFLSVILAEIANTPPWMIAARVSIAIVLLLGLLGYRRIYRETRRAARRNAELIDNLSEGVYRCTVEGLPVTANRALVRLLGFDSEPELLSTRFDSASGWYVEAARRTEFKNLLWRDGVVENFVSEIYRLKTGERIWISESARLVRDDDTGRVRWYEGSVREITDSVRRRELEDRFRKLTSLLPGGLFQLVRDPDGRFSLPYVSGGFCRTIGVPEADHIDNPRAYFSRIDERDRKLCLRSLNHSGQTLEAWSCEFRIVRHSGKRRWLHIIAQPETHGDGSTTWHGYLSDITERKQQELRIAELAYFDPLTKLPNRRVMIERMTQTLAECRRHGRHSALLYIDLDRFKGLNDTHGHEAGDQLLMKVAGRLRNTVRAEDTVARIGGDEFVVILKSMSESQAAARQSALAAAEKLLAEIRRPMQIGGLRYTTSASIGAVTFDGSERKIDDVLKRADLAMYEVKTGRRDGVAVCGTAAASGGGPVELAAELKRAIAERELQLYVQPQVDRKGNIVGGEGLLRWPSPERGLLLPDQFVPLAQNCGLSADLDLLAVDLAVSMLAGWAGRRSMSGLRLSVNVRTATLHDPERAAQIASLLAERGVPADKLTLEITEQAGYSDKTGLQESMGMLRALGVRFSLDDFGSGYGSITYLKQMQFDEVKIDGKVVTDIDGGDDDRALVRTILAMAATLGLTTVAEHVESERQEQFLRAYGCDVFQGYLYAGAMAAPKFVEFAELRAGGDLEAEPAPRRAAG